MLSELYHEMTSKYGFNGGVMIPEGIEKVREQLITLINKKLIDKTVQAYAYDRSGVHNWCLILYRNTEFEEPEVKEPEEVWDILSEIELNEELPVRMKVWIPK